MNDTELLKIVESSLLVPHECAGCEQVFLRMDMTLYMGTFFADKYTKICESCNDRAQKMYKEGKYSK